MARNFSSRAIVLEVLRKDNYANWSVCLKNYLLSQDLWDIVEETTEPPKEKDDKDGFKRWRKSNATALHAIQISCGPEILSQVRKFDTAKSARNALAMMYGEKLRVNLVTEQGNQSSNPCTTLKKSVPKFTMLYIFVFMHTCVPLFCMYVSEKLIGKLPKEQ